MREDSHVPFEVGGLGHPALVPLLHASLVLLEQHGRVQRVDGVPGDVLVRWMWRHSLGTSGRILICLNSGLPADGVLGWHELAEHLRGGWVYLGPATCESPGAERLLARLSAAGIRPVIDDEGPLWPVDAGARAVLLAGDAWHAVAGDPALVTVRAALLSHARASAVLHLSGPAGAEALELLSWAQLTLTGRGADRADPSGTWRIIQRVTELHASEVEQIRDHRGCAAPALHRSELAPPRPNSAAFAQILGESSALRSVLAEAARLAPAARLNIHIRGERGTGKELLARALHAASGRRGAFVAQDLSSVPEGLLESALFGHERGAFTGADRERRGAFRQAEGGTLFLDEIGNLSWTSQALLLRALQERAVHPVGGDRQVEVDVRILSATNLDLMREVREGRFRADLYDRLVGAALTMPALRQRAADIVPVARVMLERALGKQPLPFSPEVSEALRSWAWPGNLRELEQLMFRLAALHDIGPVPLSSLGHIAESGPAPVFILTEEPVDAADAADELRAVRRLTPLACRIPPLRERGAASVRFHLLHELRGHPVSADALAALVSYPWWGELPELRRTVAALRTAAPGVIGYSTIEGGFPHLLERLSGALIVLLHASVGEDGALVGFSRAFDAPAVLIGRARRWSDLGEEHESRNSRLTALRRRLRGATPAFLHLDHLPRLSRAHLLVCRESGELRASRFPDTGLTVRVTVLDDEYSHDLEPGAELDIGDGAEFCILDEAGSVIAQIFVYADERVREEADLWTRSRLPQGVGPTRAVPRVSNRVWILDADESRHLSTMVIDALKAGGPLSPNLHEGLLALPPEHSRLRRYLDSSNPTQSLWRLLLHPDNQPAREVLMLAIRRRTDQVRLWARLPARVQDAIAGQDEE